MHGMYNKEVLRMIDRMVNLRAFSFIGDSGDLKIDISLAQIDLITAKVRIECIPVLVPIMATVRDFGNGNMLQGADKHGNITVKNQHNEIKEIIRGILNGIEVHEYIEPKGDLNLLFKGIFVRCFIAPSDQNTKAIVRYAFDQQVLSNFCELNALPIDIESCDKKMTFPCVESAFQLCKIILTDDDDTLKWGIMKADAVEIKKYGDTVENDDWFRESSPGGPVAWHVMNYLQAWAATCPIRYNVLYNMMVEAVGLGVDPNDVYIYEYNTDSTFGTGDNPTDFAPLFSRSYEPGGKNVTGKAITNIAREVFKRKNHDNYCEWFRQTYGTLFVLKDPRPSAPSSESTSRF